MHNKAMAVHCIPQQGLNPNPKPSTPTRPLLCTAFYVFSQVSFFSFNLLARNTLFLSLSLSLVVIFNLLAPNTLPKP